MKVFIALVLVVSAAYALDEREKSRLAMENPDLYQGDILGIDPEDRNVIPYTQRRWTNKQIPYVLDRSVSSYTSLIKSAMDDYHKNTCLRFVPRTTQRNYIKIFSGNGCYSYVGMVNKGQQPLSLGNGCMYKGTIVHELGHTIGFFHEHNRSDRDKYLVIYWKNIKPGLENQFALMKSHENLLLTPFDHESVMLYGNFNFSKDRVSKTMVARNGKLLKQTYDKQGMTRSDIQRVRKMYNC